MIITLTGPTCSGKSTLEKMLAQRGLSKAISTTTRPIREGEVNGDAYYFVNWEEFESIKNESGFVECVEFGQNGYGLTVAELDRLMKLNKPIVIVCEPKGQKQIYAYCMKRGLKMFAVFVDNPMEVIAERFTARYKEAHEKTKGTDDEQLVIVTYLNRFREINTTEQGWIDEALNSEIYDMRLDSFNAENGDQIADNIADIAFGRKELA